MSDHRMTAERCEFLLERFLADRTDENRNAVALAYQPWVRHIAARVAAKLPVNAIFDLDSMAQEGQFGLLDALSRFDPSTGARFTTFAGPRVQGAMRDAIRNADWVPRLERQRTKDNPEAVTMVSHFGKLERDGDSYEPGVSDPDASGEFWEEVCSGLSPNERRIVLLYFRHQKRMHEVALLTGISESRVSQVMSQLLPRLREIQRSRMESRTPAFAPPAPPAAEAPTRPAAQFTTEPVGIPHLSVADIRAKIDLHEQELTAWRTLLEIAEQREKASAPPQKQPAKRVKRGRVVQALVEVLSAGPLGRRAIGRRMKGFRSGSVSIALRRVAEQTSTGAWKLRSEVTA